MPLEQYVLLCYNPFIGRGSAAVLQNTARTAVSDVLIRTGFKFSKNY